MFFMKNSRSSRKEKIELTEATIAELQMLHSAYSDRSSIDEISEDIRLLNEELSSAYCSSNFEYHVGRKEADADVCSKYFLKKHFIPGNISMLHDVSGSEVKSDKGILNICEDFYKTLYSDEPRDNSTQYNFVPPPRHL